jgi:hypothetical protein
VNQETFAATVEAFQSRRPYKPFTVALNNGERYAVDRPNTLAFGEGTAVIIAPGGVPIIFDHESVSQVIGDLSGRGAQAQE